MRFCFGDVPVKQTLLIILISIASVSAANAEMIGERWSPVTGNASGSHRSDHTALVFNDDMWVLDRCRVPGHDHLRDGKREHPAGQGVCRHADGRLVFYTTERAAMPYDSKGDAKYLDQRQATLSRYHANRR